VTRPIAYQGEEVCGSPKRWADGRRDTRYCSPTASWSRVASQEPHRASSQEEAWQGPVLKTCAL